MNTVIVKNCKTLFIGRRGENEVTEVLFDFSEWQEQFGAGVIDLYVKRNLDIDAYPVVLSVDGTVATWLVTAADTDVVGNGKIEYVYTVNEKIAKSAVFQFFVGDDIGESSPEPPEHYQSWLEQLTELGAETQANAQAAAQSAGEAAESASEAAESAAQVAEDSNNAEAWAVGERNGEPVSEGDPTYNNNAKYWAENAMTNAPVQSVNGEDGDVVLTLDDIPNGETYVHITPEQLAQIADNSDDIADVKATADTALQPDDLIPYRTAAAQDAIDQGQNTMIGIAIQSKQAKITASGILKGDGAGGVSAAVAGTDYATPQQVDAKYTKPSSGIPSTDMTSAVQASLQKADTALQAVPDTYRTAAAQDTIDAGKQTKIIASGILKGDGDGGISAAVAGVDYLRTAPVTSVNGQTGDVTVQVATDSQVTTAVNTWLGENVAQETGYVLDASLTMSNAAPPASAVGDLKSALTTQNDVSVNWAVGSIDSATGASIASTTRIRSLGYINKRGKSLTIDVPDGLKCSIRYYSAESESGYVKSNVNPLPTVWNTGTVVLDTTQPDYVRIVVSYTDNAQISTDEGNNVSISTVGVIGAEDIKNEFGTFSERLRNANLSLSGNYFDKNHAEMLPGFVKNTGAIDSSSGYHHSFVALQGAGNYVRIARYATFGINATNIQLFNKNKQFIKSIPGTRIGTSDLTSFVLSEYDANTAVYTVINVDDLYPDVVGLFYDSENYNFKGTRPPNANFGASTNPLYLKRIISDGDSICIGQYDLPYSAQGWHGRLRNNFSMPGLNYAASGGTITDMTNTTVGGNPRHSVVVSIDTIATENPQLDYLLLEGGTNDADLIGRFVGNTSPEKFGSWDATDYSGNYDMTTFCGAVEKTFYKALNYWPKAKIGFIIPMQMGLNNDASANRRRYFDEIVSIAKKWHIPVLDLWNESQMDSRLAVYYDSTLTNAQNVSAGKCYYDGQHPTSYGYDLMQAKIENWVMSL